MLLVGWQAGWPGWLAGWWSAGQDASGVCTQAVGPNRRQQTIPCSWLAGRLAGLAGWLAGLARVLAGFVDQLWALTVYYPMLLAGWQAGWLGWPGC